jgi:DNA-binding transcriptional ArsR family regulator
MSTNGNDQPKADDVEPGNREGMIDEEEIFKSLNHKARRDIIKHVGKKQADTFTGIKNALGEIDSPSLAYHLKSLSPLLAQKEGNYSLSGIGMAAYKLLVQTSDASRVALGKRRFLYAYFITVACWITAETIIPFLIAPSVNNANFIVYEVVINATAIANFVMIWWLRKNF